TVDVGAFNINDGEIQLNLANISPGLVSERQFFGIHGDVTNSGTLVLGTRIDVEPERFAVDGGLQLINGVDVLHRGNYTQTSTGTLAVGILPSLVRVGLNEPAFDGGGSEDPLSQLLVGVDNELFTTSEDLLGPFGELSGSIMVEGDVNLAGTVELVSPTRGIFVDGESVDFAMVTGTVTVSANTSFTSDSNFVSFGLGQRDEDGMTVLSATANRAGFDTAATSENGAAVGSAMTAALPGMVTTISDAVDGNIGLGGEAFRNAQDLANLVVGFDTLLTMEQVGQALDDIGSGAQYGTLTAIRTTAPFLGAMDPGRVTQGDGRFNVWASIQRESVDFEGDTNVGSENLESDSFGLSAGIGILTEGGEWGLGFGYGETEAEADDLSFVADAETWMMGAFAQQEWRGFTFSGDVVFAWSEWVADRDLGVLSREAFAEFDSKEIRTDIAGSYMFDFDQGWVAPFAELSFRYFNFDSFTEEGAGSLNLIVEDAENTVVNPIIGARAGSSYTVGGAVVRPELLLSYTFQGDNEALRDVAASFAPDTEFRLEGVDPEGFLTVGGGVNADFSRNASAFVRGSFSPGNNYETANITAGVQIRF
ncbi:MAG: autotransporter outer membrane beta-barrel domain-containing protein, partial [Planctomycetota bacterium]